MRSPFCNQITKTPNSTKVNVEIICFGEIWWPGDLMAFLFVFFHEIAMIEKSQTEMNISSWLFHTTT